MIKLKVVVTENTKYLELVVFHKLDKNNPDEDTCYSVDCLHNSQSVCVHSTTAYPAYQSSYSVCHTLVACQADLLCICQSMDYSPDIVLPGSSGHEDSDKMVCCNQDNL